VQPVDVASIFQTADRLKLVRSALENKRRRKRFESITGGIAKAFLPAPKPETEQTEQEES
jgi:hypothetical protein